MGTYFWGAALVTIFSVIRGRRVGPSVKFFVIFGAGVLLSLMALTRPVRHLVADPAQMGKYFGKVTKNSATAQLDKWAVATRPFFMELIDRNRQYLDDVSKLDAALQPLYSPASFRDAASVQAMLDALAQRLAIADKYADIQPVIAKMPGYVATVNATDKEKQEFLAGFNQSIAKAVNGRNSVPALEHNWIASAIDLYEFLLAHPYSYNFGNIMFKGSADAAAFNSKLNKSRDLYAQFLRAYQSARHAEDALLAQMGLNRSDIGLDHPQ